MQKVLANNNKPATHYIEVFGGPQGYMYTNPFCHFKLYLIDKGDVYTIAIFKIRMK